MSPEAKLQGFPIDTAGQAEAQGVGLQPGDGSPPGGELLGEHAADGHLDIGLLHGAPMDIPDQGAEPGGQGADPEKRAVPVHVVDVEQQQEEQEERQPEEHPGAPAGPEARWLDLDHHRDA